MNWGALLTELLGGGSGRIQDKHAVGGRADAPAGTVQGLDNFFQGPATGQSSMMDAQSVSNDQQKSKLMDMLLQAFGGSSAQQ